VRRGVLLSLQIEQKLSGEGIFRRSVASASRRRARFFFQETEPIGGVIGGCEVSSTLPDFCVPRWKRKTADRDSTPSGETATIGIS
jgi:hypothetical protein